MDKQWYVESRGRWISLKKHLVNRKFDYPYAWFIRLRLDKKLEKCTRRFNEIVPEFALLKANRIPINQPITSVRARKIDHRRESVTVGRYPYPTSFQNTRSDGPMNPSLDRGWCRRLFQHTTRNHVARDRKCECHSEHQLR